MNNNRAIIAAAGSGKTRMLVEEALAIKNQNVLITTFTEANEASIKNRIIETTGGYIPQNIVVQTWFSFLLQHGVRPFQDVMSNYLWDKTIGFCLNEGVSSFHTGARGGYSLNPKNDFFPYYFISKTNLSIFSDKISEFICACNEKKGGEVMNRISNIFPYLFIDEAQDLAAGDFDLLKLIFDSSMNVTLVCDPRQAVYSTNGGKGNKKYKGKILKFLEDMKILIDDKSLTVNFRCNQYICSFANRIFPEYSAVTSGLREKEEHEGIFFVREDDVDNYLNSYPGCMQLRWSCCQNVNDKFDVMTYGNSKGLEFNRVLIYPTKSIIGWIKNTSVDFAPSSRCKFYVAVTRAKYSVGIVYNYDDMDYAGIRKYDPTTV